MYPARCTAATISETPSAFNGSGTGHGGVFKITRSVCYRIAPSLSHHVLSIARSTFRRPFRVDPKRKSEVRDDRERAWIDDTQHTSCQRILGTALCRRCNLPALLYPRSSSQDSKKPCSISTSARIPPSSKLLFRSVLCTSINVLLGMDEQLQFVSGRQEQRCGSSGPSIYHPTTPVRMRMARLMVSSNVGQIWTRSMSSVS